MVELGWGKLGIAFFNIFLKVEGKLGFVRRVLLSFNSDPTRRIFVSNWIISYKFCGHELSQVG